MFSALLVDWRGTLAVPLTEEQWIGTALERLARPAAPSDIAPIAACLEAVDAGRRLLTPGMDADPALHRRVFMDVFSDADIDPDLAAALYEVESDPFNDLFADDALGFLSRTRAAGVRVAIVSDVHVDIRPAFRAVGLDAHVDAYALSCEHGAEKPDPRLFEAALGMVDARPEEALMVGDRHTHDGGAAAVGVAALILPSLTTRAERRLHLVERLLSAAQRPDSPSTRATPVGHEPHPEGSPTCCPVPPTPQ
ncbi:HAD family hydrolase [Nocardiopsis sp. RSe5-2]|uniref:HAD family hydrolase n=1 Tax=Nocardiopsis endophytica TaxID=3018445 RepID=A0ABT4U867_9ACTN|nr:HAD family hydrolase [Nocardiopsis endophytica]MDA2813152.1 HAD family hydrolase [Nocardiopsis endophytica]